MLVHHRQKLLGAPKTCDDQGQDIWIFVWMDMRLIVDWSYTSTFCEAESKDQWDSDRFYSNSVTRFRFKKNMLPKLARSFSPACAGVSTFRLLFCDAESKWENAIGKWASICWTKHKIPAVSPLLMVHFMGLNDSAAVGTTEWIQRSSHRCRFPREDFPYSSPLGVIWIATKQSQNSDFNHC